MASNTTKRARKPNFTQPELEILVDEVSKNRNILMGKFSDTVTNEKKKKIWGHITVKINSSSHSSREVDDVKKKWQDWSSIVKGKASKLQRERKKTGGGEQTEPSLSALEEKVLSVIGVTAVEGLDVMMPDTFERSVDIVDTTDHLTTCTETDSTDTSMYGSNEIEKLWDTSINSIIEQHTNTSSATATCTHTSPPPSSTFEPSVCKTLGRKRKIVPDSHEEEASKIYALEREKLSIEKERLKIEQERLAVEKSRQRCEEEILNILQCHVTGTTTGAQLPQDEMNTSMHFTCL
ncbi:myb/SANT-like DNA-binding domain-containing protein 4 [Pecten maximus]|uniref:myb/SANT-like DNA-binding domain-containing protein 4 n=1 Tax=Pecten maximus TaxID=6579 RepID=UPI001458B810|nr:myb/SANT-like DNA-binding domain-containing protein 4 [Pecten maximus]